MPFWQPYDQMLKSPIADVNHISGGAFAGSVTAAMFLKRFAPKGSIYGHFDVYCWVPKAKPGRPMGGEPQAARAVFRALGRGCELVMSALDRRTNAYRDDLAAKALEGRVAAPRFVEGTKRQVVIGLASLKRTPEASSRQDTEALFGETVTVYDTRDGWAWVQLASDGYVGYVLETSLGPRTRRRIRSSPSARSSTPSRTSSRQRWPRSVSDRSLPSPGLRARC